MIWIGRSNSTRASCSLRSIARSSARPAASLSASCWGLRNLAAAVGGHPVHDIEALQKISGVAAAAFAPFVAGAHPAMFGVDRFSGLEQPLNLAGAFDQMEYFHWNDLRTEEDVRFVGLTMPRVLMRLPYEDDGTRADGFPLPRRRDRPRTAAAISGAPPYMPSARC